MTTAFKGFQKLYTAQTIMRKLSSIDADALMQLRSDEQVNQYLDRPKTCTRQDAEAFITKINSFVDAGDSYYWAITMSTSPKLIGTICYYNLSDDKTMAELGYELLPEYQGKGIMHEAINEVIRFGMADAGFKVITALPTPDNAPSVKLLEKIGFKLDDTYQYVSKEEAGEQAVYVLLS